jgi:cyclase
MRRCLPFLFISLFASVVAFGQQDVQIEPVKITESLYMLKGSGGNMGLLSIGEDGALLIDDQFAPLSEKIVSAVGKLTDKPIRFVLNTHWHGDHTGGNANLGKAGAVIVAHENVRVRMSKGQFLKAFNRHVDPAPREALPVVTFTKEMTLHWNDDDLMLAHVDPAHTDGDTFVYFEKANVLHTGDLFFNGFYPFVDSSSAGDFAGMIAAGKTMLDLIDDKTVVIPGHGPLSNKGELQAFILMMEGVHGNLKAMIDAGKSRDDVVAAKPTATFDEKWGGGFLVPDKWVGIVYDTIAKKPE